MRHAYALAVAFVAIATLPQTAQAQSRVPEQRFYIGGFAGSEMPDKQELSGLTVSAARRDIVIDYDNGSLIGGYIGMVVAEASWGRVRADLELSRRESDPDNIVLNDITRELVDGSDSSVSAGLLNLSYDTPQYWDRLRFSVGAGAGIANVDNEILYIVNNPAATNGGRQSVALPASESTWAYQLRAGAELSLNSSWSLVGDVRYFDIGDYEVQRFILNTPGVGAGINGTLDSILPAEWSSTSVSVGLRYAF